jgi:hypothetical protein
MVSRELPTLLASGCSHQCHRFAVCSPATSLLCAVSGSTRRSRLIRSCKPCHALIGLVVYPGHTISHPEADRRHELLFLWLLSVCSCHFSRLLRHSTPSDTLHDTLPTKITLSSSCSWTFGSPSPACPFPDTYHVALIHCLVFRTCLLNTRSLHGSLLFIPRFVLFFHCCMPWLVCDPLPLPVAASIPLLLSAHFFSNRRPTPFDTPQSLEHTNPSLL